MQVWSSVNKVLSVYFLHQASPRPLLGVTSPPLPWAWSHVLSRGFSNSSMNRRRRLEPGFLCESRLWRWRENRRVCVICSLMSHKVSQPSCTLSLDSDPHNITGIHPVDTVTFNSKKVYSTWHSLSNYTLFDVWIHVPSLWVCSSVKYVMNRESRL